jgi:phenylalanyl-tRNA synthetase alpha chain
LTQPGTENPITSLREEALERLSAAQDAAALEQWRVEFLGRKGRLTGILRNLGSMEESERRSAGAAANRLKGELEEAFAEHSSASQKSGASAAPADAIDVTLPGRRSTPGRLHPSTQMIREMLAAFNEMGFQTVEGNEVELERYNFDMLNIPADHPARDMQDTIWINQDRSSVDGGVLLRTQTSPMQPRTMEKQDPPVRIVSPGKCFRIEATDATHEWQFHQVEGLAVDEGLSFADLKGTLYEFARRIFGANRKVRFRNDFFPFVEPGVDMSVDWNGRWVEILGAGMVHPQVLRNVGYDPEKYTGFAFGVGPERVAMLKYGIEDIRHFFSNDLRFLSQF